MLPLLYIQLLHLSVAVFLHSGLFFLWHFSQTTLKWTRKCALLFSYPGHEVHRSSLSLMTMLKQQGGRWQLPPTLKKRDDFNRPRRSRLPFQTRWSGAALPSRVVMTSTSISGAPALQPTPFVFKRCEAALPKGTPDAPIWSQRTATFLKAVRAFDGPVSLRPRPGF